GASCTGWGRGPPLFKTRDAAICEAPTFRPTISCFFARFFFALLGLGTPGFRPFFGRRKSSESLISLFRSMCLYTSEASRRPLSVGVLGLEKPPSDAPAAGRLVMPERSSRPRSWSGRDERENAVSGVITRRSTR